VHLLGMWLLAQMHIPEHQAQKVQQQLKALEHHHHLHSGC
jgi:hypothetical protein